MLDQRLREVRKLLSDQPDSESRPVLQGEVSTLSLAEVLQLLHQGHRSGTLKIRDGEREKVLYLDRGDVHVLRVEQSESDQEVWDLLLGDETRSSINLTEHSTSTNCYSKKTPQAKSQQHSSKPSTIHCGCGMS